MSTRSTLVTRRKQILVPTALVLGLLLTALAASAAAPPFIDAFNTNQASGAIIIGNGATGSDTTTNPGDLDLLRAERNVYVHNVVAPAGQVVSVNVNAGQFTHSQNSQTTANSVLTYDGSGPGYPSTLFNGLCTPGCVDLTQGSTTNGFTFNVVFDDLAMDVRIRVYDGSGAGRWSERTLTNLLPGAPSGFSGPVFVEFPSITLGTSGPNGPANFANVGAIEFEFIGKTQATDLTIDSINISVFDWGDLPETSPCASSVYATTVACQGPRHVVTSGLRLGAQVDPGVSPASAGEINGQPSADAKGDDNANIDDEDGVVPANLPWVPAVGNGGGVGTVDVTVQGTGWLVGWVDVNGNGFQASEAFINQSVTPGTVSGQFIIPAGTVPVGSTATLYARFRLFPPGEMTEALGPYAFDGRDQFNQFIPLGLTPPGQSKGGEVEDHVYYVSRGTLAVTLADLRAEAQSDHVLVTWETVSEMNNQGFNLYRSTSPDAAGQKINAALIPSQAPGSAQGAVYTWQDADVTAGTTYFYTLEDLDINGASTLHGPVSVVFQAPTAVTLNNLTANPAGIPASLPLGAASAAAGLAALLAAAWQRQRSK